MRYKIGDVVRLRSGGPDMTVETLRDFPTCNIYHCVYYDEELKRFTRVELGEEVLKEVT